MQCMCAIKAYPSKAPFRSYTEGRLLALFVNIRLDLKGLPRTNSQAYYKHTLFRCSTQGRLLALLTTSRLSWQGQPGKINLVFLTSPFRCSTLRWASNLTHKHQIKLEMHAKDKHSSLLRNFSYQMLHSRVGLPSNNLLGQRGFPQTNPLAYYEPFPIRCSTREQAPSLTHKHRLGWKSLQGTNPLAYYEHLPFRCSTLEQAPGFTTSIGFQPTSRPASDQPSNFQLKFPFQVLNSRVGSWLYHKYRLKRPASDQPSNFQRKFPFQVFHSRVGSWPYQQVLDQAGQSCQRQKLQFITNISQSRPQKVLKHWALGPGANVIKLFVSVICKFS